jgi:hypothetical protein
MRGNRYNVEGAARDLNEVKVSIADEFANVRDRIWFRNLSFVGGAAIAAIPGGALFYAAQNNLWNVPKVQIDAAHPGNFVFHPAVAAALAFLWIPLGAALGVFLEFMFSVDREISFRTSA